MVIIMVFCRNCGKNNDDSSNFCINCGAKLKENLIKCRKCGKFNEADSNYCIDCGNILKQNNYSNVHEKSEKNVEFSDNPYLELLSKVEKILSIDEKEKDKSNINSSNIKSEPTGNGPDADKNLNKNLDDEIIENDNPKEETPIKQKNNPNNIKNDQNTLSKKTEEKDTSPPSEVILLPAVKTFNCDICDSEILNDDSFKICESCCIRIANYLDLLCEDFEINTKMPLKNLYQKAEYHKLSRKDIEDITTALLKYGYLHKIDTKIHIEYNEELRNFINKYSTKTENKNDNIKNNINLVVEKIGLNTPFDVTYLKETLNFKNSEISKMIKYLDEKKVIIEDEDYFILIDNPNEISSHDDNITSIKSEHEI